MSDRADRIEKRGSKYVVLSKAGGVLGEHDTPEGAERQLRAVEASKAREGNDRGDDGSVWRYDAVELRMDQAVQTPEGWRRIPAIIGRGDVILPYLNGDGTIRREFRPASEVTDPPSVESFSGVPVTNDHPPVHLDSTTARRFQLGSSASATAEGANLMSSVLLTDESIISDVEAGKVQLSPGYRVVFDATPGVFKGERYDGVQRHIRGNHIAVVDRGRQGPAVSLRMDSGDAVLATTTEERNMLDDDKNPKAKKVTVRLDGQDIECDEATAAILTDAEEKRKATALALDEAKTNRADTDAKLAALQAKVEGLTAPPEPKDKPDVAARLDALEAAHKVELKAVQDKADADIKELELRLDVVATAKSIIPKFDPGSKSRSDVMVEVIGQVLGDDAKKKVQDKADSGYTEAFYEQAITSNNDRKNRGGALLKIAKGGKKGEYRKDVAGDAMREANERKRNAHKTA